VPSVAAPMSNLGEGPLGRADQLWLAKLKAHTSSEGPDAGHPPTTTIRSRAGSEIAAGDPRDDGPLGASTRVQDRASNEKIHTSFPAPNPPNTTALRLVSRTAATVQRGEGPGSALS